MKMIIIFLTLFTMGCTKPPVKHENRGPAPAKRYPYRTMLCNGKPEKKIRVAVIDTGFGYEGKGIQKHLCNTGHKDFTSDHMFAGFNTKDAVPLDMHGHGTNVVGVIEKYAKDVNYCIIVLKYFSALNTKEDSGHTIEAIEYATRIGADVINYSGGGIEPSLEEAAAVKKFIDKGGRFIAAAGNEQNDLSMVPYFPAMDDARVISVGNIYRNGQRSPTSNYGTLVTRWEVGVQEAYGIFLEGTSQSTAVATGKIISEKKCKIPVDSVSK